MFEETHESPKIQQIANSESRCSLRCPAVRCDGKHCLCEDRGEKTALRSGDILTVEPRELEGIVGDHVYLTVKIDSSALDEAGNMPRGTLLVWSWSCGFLDWDDVGLPEGATFGFTAYDSGQGTLQVQVIDTSIHKDGTGPVPYSDYCAVSIEYRSDGGGSGGCNTATAGCIALLFALLLLHGRRVCKN
jgi:hypothetical protein